jgi:hypothetical protein
VSDRFLVPVNAGINNGEITAAGVIEQQSLPPAPTCEAASFEKTGERLSLILPSVNRPITALLQQITMATYLLLEQSRG